MSSAFVQGKDSSTQSTGTNTSSLTFTSNNTAGNLLVVSGALFGSSGTLSSITVSDTQGNGSWTTAKMFPTNAADNGIFFAYCLNCKAGANTITITQAGDGSSGLTWFYGIAEFSGVSAFDATNATRSNTTSTAVTCGSTVTSKNDLIFGWATSYSGGTTFTPPSGYANSPMPSGILLEYNLSVAAGTIAPTSTAGASINYYASSTGFVNAVATPTFSPVAGTYAGTQNVTISSTDSGLTGFAIYYTTDGSTPTTGSTLYTGPPVAVASSLTLKAIASATSYGNSVVGSAAYTINAAASAAKGPSFGINNGIVQTIAPGVH